MGGDAGAEDDPGFPDIGPQARFARAVGGEGQRQLAHLWMLASAAGCRETVAVVGGALLQPTSCRSNLRLGRSAPHE